jgi:hypothetical protein
MLLTSIRTWLGISRKSVTSCSLPRRKSDTLLRLQQNVADTLVRHDQRPCRLPVELRSWAELPRPQPDARSSHDTIVAGSGEKACSPSGPSHWQMWS